MNPLSQKKAFHTALVISPPVSEWAQIQEIRKFYDTAYSRWMPHLNMSFPFVIEQDFDIASSILQEALKDFDPFKIELKTLGSFSFEKDSVIWVAPDVNDEINKLEQIILKNFPFCDELVKKSPEGFKAHMTLGRFDEKIVAKKLNEFQEKWKTVTFTVNELYMIFRQDSESPFFIIKTMHFKNAEGESNREKINKEMQNFVKEFYQTNFF